ncbi:hypothetical protein JTE90_008017 [Oedothorax gibbosus]|uniref:Uncharacterized protein n=1 Tax=Oedothorax gibbosus TaxID=931172 RepID=A0AAV6UVX7_9ARAC|nr:hypothetical protein JTE90_008017 [Oedothorax gibbosus]
MCTCLRNPSSQSSVLLESWCVWKKRGHPRSAYNRQSNSTSGQSRVRPSKAITILALDFLFLSDDSTLLFRYLVRILNRNETR